jgi:hypothetical protein
MSSGNKDGTPPPVPSTKRPVRTTAAYGEGNVPLTSKPPTSTGIPQEHLKYVNGAPDFTDLSELEEIPAPPTVPAPQTTSFRVGDLPDPPKPYKEDDFYEDSDGSSGGGGNDNYPSLEPKSSDNTPWLLALLIILFGLTFYNVDPMGWFGENDQVADVADNTPDVITSPKEEDKALTAPGASTATDDDVGLPHAATADNDLPKRVVAAPKLNTKPDPLPSLGAYMKARKSAGIPISKKAVEKKVAKMRVRTKKAAAIVLKKGDTEARRIQAEAKKKAARKLVEAKKKDAAAMRTAQADIRLMFAAAEVKASKARKKAEGEAAKILASSESKIEAERAVKFELEQAKEAAKVARDQAKREAKARSEELKKLLKDQREAYATHQREAQKAAIEEAKKAREVALEKVTELQKRSEEKVVAERKAEKEKREQAVKVAKQHHEVAVNKTAELIKRCPEYTYAKCVPWYRSYMRSQGFKSRRSYREAKVYCKANCPKVHRSLVPAAIKVAKEHEKAELKKMCVEGSKANCVAWLVKQPRDEGVSLADQRKYAGIHCSSVCQ